MKTFLEIFYLANLKYHLILRTVVGFSFHDPLNTTTFALQHQQECRANSLYLLLITLNLVPSLTDPFRREEKQAHIGDSLTRIPTASLFETLIGGRILMLGTVWGQVCWEQGCWSRGWRRGSLTPSGNTAQRGRVKALPSVPKRKGDQSVQAFSGRGRHQCLLFPVLSLNFDMVITDLSFKLPKLENPIIKRAGGREREERKRGKKERRGRKR